MQCCCDFGDTAAFQQIAAVAFENSECLLDVLAEFMSCNPRFADWVKGLDFGKLRGSIYDLLNCLYWHRVWCLQELAVSETVIVTTGNESVDLYAFETFMRAFVAFLYLFYIWLATISLDMPSPEEQNNQAALSHEYESTVTLAERMLA